jgi:hypothetical protein
MRWDNDITANYLFLKQKKAALEVLQNIFIKYMEKNCLG